MKSLPLFLSCNLRCSEIISTLRVTVLADNGILSNRTFFSGQTSLTMANMHSLVNSASVNGYIRLAISELTTNAALVTDSLSIGVARGGKGAMAPPEF